jgi:hypothetical protein
MTFVHRNGLIRTREQRIEASFLGALIASKQLIKQEVSTTAMFTDLLPDLPS